MKAKKICLTLSQLIFCLLCFYSFLYCCFCSIKPIRFLFLKFRDFKNIFFAINGGMLSFYFPLLFLGILSIITLLINYRKSKIMATLLILTIFIVGVLVYTFAISSNDIFHSNIKYLYWFLCCFFFCDLIYSIRYFIKHNCKIKH